jgi:hypothetical protein
VGEIERADAAVAGLLNIVLRALVLEQDIREQEELAERIEDLEKSAESRGWGAYRNA